MAKLMIGVVVGVVVFAGKMLLHPAMPDTLEAREAFFAKGVNAAAPVAVGPYSSMTGAKVSDGVLELDVQLSPTAPKITMDSAFMHGFEIGTCRNTTFNDLIKKGGSVRMTFTNPDGQVLPPATVSSCPTS